MTGGPGWYDEPFLDLVDEAYRRSLGDARPAFLEFREHAARFVDYCRNGIGTIEDAAREATWLNIYLNNQRAEVDRIMRDVRRAVQGDEEPR